MRIPGSRVFWLLIFISLGIPTILFLGLPDMSEAPAAVEGVSPAGGGVAVKGHRRKDGTYVRPHTRRAPTRR